MTRLSVVSPVYRAAGCIAELHRRLSATLRSMNVEHEIVLVDDGSDDGSADAIRRIDDPRVKAVILERNHGQQRAIAEGLARATGEWVVVMDCDLQDPPEAIPMLFEAREGADIVLARRTRRKGSALRRIASRTWCRMIGIEPGLGNFSVIHRRVVDAVLKRAGEPYLLVLLGLPFRRRAIDVEHAERFHGRSSYTLARLVRHAIRSARAR
jgi:glycosyltransferase involved in cell wall biosynthesis